MNREYGKIEEDGRLTYAPSVIWIGDSCICNPREQDYNQVGWFNVFDEKPSEKVGVYFIPSGWEYVMRDGRKVIVRTYREEPLTPPPPPVTRYSKLKLIVAAKAAGKWAAFKAFIASAGYEDEWAACQFLSSDYAQFAAAKEAIIAAGIATAEEVEAILAASVDEEV